MKPLDEDQKRALDLIEKNKKQIHSSWLKQESLSPNRDLLAYLKLGTEGTVATLLASRKTLLTVLEAEGIDLSDKAFDPVREPAVAQIPSAVAIWVLVNVEGKIHITQMIREATATGGSA